MAQGPPSTEAGSSSTREAQAGYPYPHHPYFSPQNGSSAYYAGYQYAWTTPWPANYAQSHAYTQYHLPQPPQVPVQPPDIKREEKSVSPSPPAPSQKFHREWDSVIKSFLSVAGLSQALRGFEADMIILNPEWERENVPNALGGLLKALLQLGQDVEWSEEERSLDERKLGYIHTREGVQPRSQTSVNKEISMFLAKNRARINESNRNEFLLSLAEKRRRSNEQNTETPSSCARTDAKPVDRDLQMKYDIAKNEEGPLRKTVKLEEPLSHEDKAASPVVKGDDEGLPSIVHPGLDGRLKNIETHLAVRYVPSPPRLILDRIKFLEDHIIALEKAYPPWAALHFNQPNRGWPPPPRPTPIIVPPRMLENSEPIHDSSLPDNGKGKSKATSSRRGRGSSLHRAVMERLEVQKAKSDLARETSMDVDDGG